MLCPVCRKENEEGNHNCINCGSRLTKRRNRRRNGESDSSEPAADYKLAWFAYRCGVIALIPFVGLVMGPVAFFLGIVAWWQYRIDPWDKGLGPAGAAMILGLLVSVTMWTGLALMVHAVYPGYLF